MLLLTPVGVADQEVDVKQQEIILRDSRAAYGRALCKEDMDVGSVSMEQHMNSLFPVCPAGPPRMLVGKICACDWGP